MKKNLFLILIILLLTACNDKTYKVTFMDEGKELSSATIKAGETIKNVTSPTKEGYIFVTWLKDGEEYDANAKVSDDMTLTASWTKIPENPNNHTVTFNFGEYMKTQTVKDGEPVPKPKEDPVKEKHTFLGWYVGDSLYDFETPVVKDIIIVAKYKRDQVVIEYDLVGGVGTVQVEIDKGSIPDRPKDPTKFGYSFVGWLLDGKPYNFDFPINEDTTIKANWEAVVYVTVYFNSDGGDEIKSQTIPKGSKLESLPTPTKEGYTFKYWALFGEKFDTDIKIVEELTLVAIYEKNKPEDSSNNSEDTEP